MDDLSWSLSHPSVLLVQLGGRVIKETWLVIRGANVIRAQGAWLEIIEKYEDLGVHLTNILPAQVDIVL